MIPQRQPRDFNTLTNVGTFLYSLQLRPQPRRANRALQPTRDDRDRSGGVLNGPRSPGRRGRDRARAVRQRRAAACGVEWLRRRQRPPPHPQRDRGHAGGRLDGPERHHGPCSPERC